MSKTNIRRLAVRLVTHLAGAVILLSTVTACDTDKTDKGRQHNLACLEARGQGPTPAPALIGPSPFDRRILDNDNISVDEPPVTIPTPLPLASGQDVKHLPPAPGPTDPSGTANPSTANPTGCW